MLQGICVDVGNTTVLEKGTSYYLFPKGSKHYFVSKFPNPGAHKGCFQAKHFQIVEKEEWPEEPAAVSINLDPERVYKAKLIWRRPGYKFLDLKEYFIKPRETHCDFYHDSSLKELGGCFPLHWFSDFAEFTPVENDILEIIDQEIPDFDIDFEENVPFFLDSEPKITKYEQLSLFDF